MEIRVIKTRDGDLVPYDRSRIEIVIEKAAEAVGIKDFSFIDPIMDKIENKLKDFLIDSE